MSEVEIQVGDWVCLKCPAPQITNIPMLVKHCAYGEATVIWFLEDRNLSEKVIPIKLLEIFKEENWA